MKVKIEFKSAEEREAYLGVVSIAMNPPSLDLNEVEKALYEQLIRALQRFYIDGSGRKVNIEKQEDFRKEAIRFFEE